jgi:hypothetical protein
MSIADNDGNDVNDFYFLYCPWAMAGCSFFPFLSSPSISSLSAPPYFKRKNNANSPSLTLSKAL